MGNAKVVVLVAIAVLVGAYFYLDLDAYLNLANIKMVRDEARAYVDANALVSTVGFFSFYVLVTACSLPGAAVMTVAAGALFGLVWAVVLVSFASSVGATLAMLISRTLLRDWVQGRFAAQLQTVNAGLRKDGGFYLFSLRMVPLFPFFIVNMVMGLSHMSAWRFYWVSQLGMLAGTFVYVFAGTQLVEVESMSDVLSPGLAAALTMLGLFPLAARKGIEWLNRSRSAH